MNLRMDLKLKKDELLAERTACEQAKQDAHNRIIEINKTLKKLENIIAEADEILGVPPNQVDDIVFNNEGTIGGKPIYNLNER